MALKGILGNVLPQKFYLTSNLNVVNQHYVEHYICCSSHTNHNCPDNKHHIEVAVVAGHDMYEWSFV